MVRSMDPQKLSDIQVTKPPSTSTPWYKRVGTGLLMLSLTVGGGIFGGFAIHRQQVGTQFEDSVSALSTAQDQWLAAAERIISNAGSLQPTYPDPDQIDTLRDEVLQTALELGRFRSPDEGVAEAALKYKQSLEAFAGVLNQYDGSHTAFVTVVSAAQNAANIGGDFYVNVDDYSTSFLRKSFQAIGLG